MKTTITAGLLGLLLSSQVLAFGEVGRWSSGWGQGVTEYVVVDAKQNQLYIACGDEPAHMTLTVAGREYGYGTNQDFSLVIDGKEVEGMSDADSRVGSDNFRYAWDRIRKAKSLAAKLPNGKLVPLPLTGAAKVLPASNSKGFPCHTLF